MHNRTKTAIFVLVVIAAMVAGFFILFEKVEKERYVAASSKAMRNPFLAAERFLKASGIDAEGVARKETLINLPPTSHMIFVNRLGGNLPKEREDALLDWVYNGGCLVITHDRFWNEISDKSGNTLLDRLQVRLLNPEIDEEETTGESEENFEDTSPEPDDDVDEASIRDYFDLHKKESVFVVFEDGDSAELSMNARRTLHDDSDIKSTFHVGESGPHIIERRMFEGRLFILSDNRFLTNKEIGNKDHAWFLQRLAEDREKVWILYNSLMPSFLTILMDNAQFFLGALVLFVIAFLLRLNMTIGPVGRIIDYSNRNIIENLLASGTFMMRHKKSAYLIHRTRKQIENDFIRKNLRSDGKADDKTYERIAKRTGLSENQVRQAFLAEAGNSEDFIRITRLLQQIHLSLLVNSKKTEKS